MSTLSLMPWKTHAVLAVVCPAFMVTPGYRMLSFEPTDRPLTDLFMSVGVLVFIWLVAAGMLWLEIDAVAGHRMSEARWVAFVAHMWLAWVGTMYLWLGFAVGMGDQVDPIATRHAVVNYGLLLVGYLLCLLAGVVLQQRSESRLDPDSLRIDERAE